MGKKIGYRFGKVSHKLRHLPETVSLFLGTVGFLKLFLGAVHDHYIKAMALEVALMLCGIGAFAATLGH